MSSTFSGDETTPFFGFLDAATALVFSCMGAVYRVWYGQEWSRSGVHGCDEAGARHEVDCARYQGRDLELEVRVLEKAESARANFVEDDDNDINIVVDERDDKDDELVERDDSLIMSNKTDAFDFVIGSVMMSEQIPGLSGGLENRGSSNYEDEWESEDDLHVVLNDNNQGRMGMEGRPGVDDEDDVYS